MGRGVVQVLEGWYMQRAEKVELDEGADRSSESQRRGW